MPEYFIRIRLKEEPEAEKTARYISESFSAEKALAAFEYGEKNGNPHIHIYLDSPRVFKNDKAKQLYMNKLGYKGNGAYNCQIVQDRLACTAYTIKDKKIVYRKNITNEEYEEMFKHNQKVVESMKMSTIKKIEKFIQDNKLDLSTPYKCKVAVMAFYKSLEKAPRNVGLLLYYANSLYIKQQKSLSPEALLAQLFKIYEEPEIKTKEEKALEELKHLESKHKRLLQEMEQLGAFDDSEDDDSESQL